MNKNCESDVNGGLNQHDRGMTVEFSLEKRYPTAAPSSRCIFAAEVAKPDARDDNQSRYERALSIEKATLIRKSLAKTMEKREATT